jgi:protein O-GlcNAc transferase
MPTDPATFNLAVQYQQAGRLEEAERLCCQIVAADPAHAEAWHLLGVIALQAGNSATAVESLGQAATLDPQNAEVHNNLAIALKTCGRGAAAIEHFRAAANLRPGSFALQYNLASALSECRQFAEAEPIFRRLLAARPDAAEVWFLLGSIETEQGRLAEAIEHLQQSLRLRPNVPEALLHLGAALQGQIRLNEALACYEQAIAARPDFVEAYHRLAEVLRLLGRVDESVALFRQLVQQRPDDAQSLNNLAVALKDAAQLDEAIEYFRRAIALRPDVVHAHGNLLYSIQFSPKYDRAAIFAEHRRFNERHALPLAPAKPPVVDSRDPGRRLRVGYVSPNFRVHCQALFTLPLFRHHDREQFEIVGYCDDPAEDPVTAELRGLSDAWHNIVGMTDEQAAARIRDDRLDILVDLTMHMYKGRPLLFARKPAPIQACWLAYPGTTGLTAIDYRLTDPHLDPPDLFDAYYAETSLRLPDTFWCFDPLAVEPAVNPLPALQNGFITFGNLNNPCKTNDAVFELWAGVLKAVEGSRLMLIVPQASYANRLFSAFERYGVASDRIVPVEMRPRPRYLELYHQIDIGLDTFPYNGHTTSLDSYWMGVPVVTLVGNTVVGRAGLSQLTNLGLEELVAYTPSDFITISASLPSNLPRLAALRSSLRQRLESSPLTNAPRFARNLESAYRQMWDNYLNAEH